MNGTRQPEAFPLLPRGLPRLLLVVPVNEVESDRRLGWGDSFSGKSTDIVTSFEATGDEVGSWVKRCPVIELKRCHGKPMYIAIASGLN